MIITVASFKGGQGKTTTSIHLAGLLSGLDGPALLVDSDPNRSALSWTKRAKQPFPFTVCTEHQLGRQARAHEHIVIDTNARPSKSDLKELSEGCDLMIVPVTPDALSLDALFLLSDTLEELQQTSFRVLVTIVPPKPSKAGDEAQETLREAGLPVFNTQVRRLVAFQKSALEGCLVKDCSDTRSQEAWSDYQNLFNEIQNNEQIFRTSTRETAANF